MFANFLAKTVADVESVDRSESVLHAACVITGFGRARSVANSLNASYVSTQVHMLADSFNAAGFTARVDRVRTVEVEVSRSIRVDDFIILNGREFWSVFFNTQSDKGMA